MVGWVKKRMVKSYFCPLQLNPLVDWWDEKSPLLYHVLMQLQHYRMIVSFRPYAAGYF